MPTVPGLKDSKTAEMRFLMNSDPKSRIICPVIVVPTFAPMITPRDCRREIIPAPTSPEVITMVAVDDWIIAVIPFPAEMP